ncbi:MAG: GAF domain-containing protein [Minwuia sp.]|uniref:GAF domain-containing protein n=1 Tax=Minwuia sp. TaxID=2493630 RepID=UPI003A8995BD
MANKLQPNIKLTGSAEIDRATYAGAYLTPPRRSIAYLELVIGIALLLAIDYAFGSMDGFETLNPNPYWIPIILLSVQYGVFEGLIAAVVCAVVSILSGIDPDIYQLILSEGPGAALDRAAGASFETFTNEDYLIAWDYAAQPLLWVITALFIGLLRERLRERNRELAINLGQTTHREKVLSDAYNQLLDTKEQLEVRVAGQLRTVFTLYQAAKAIEKLGPGEVLIGIADLVRAVMQPTKFSLYLLNGSVLEAVTNDGWEDDDTFQRVFDSGTPLFQEVVGRQRFLSAVNSQEQRILGGEGILAGPLTSVDTGEVVGMLKIEQLGFLELHVSSLENFRILSDWVGTAFANARRFRKAQGNMFMNEDRTLFTDVVYRTNAKLMKQFGERFGLGVTAVIVKAEGLDVLHAERRQAVIRALKQVLDNHMPPTVMAHEYRQAGREFALIVPGANPVTAGPELAAKVEKAVEHYLKEASIEGVDISTTVKALHTPGGAEGQPKEKVAG